MQETTRNEPNGRQRMKCEQNDNVKNNIERMRLTVNGESVDLVTWGILRVILRESERCDGWCMHRGPGIRMSGNDCTLFVESTQREGDCSQQEAREAADKRSCHASCGLAQLDALAWPSSS